jgi:hypothetical protein
MADFIMLMHDDAPGGGAFDWDPYLTKLRETEVFQGGSAIGEGSCECKTGRAPAATAHITGFIRIAADDLDHARRLLAGNPVYEAGGTVEIRALLLGS